MPDVSPAVHVAEVRRIERELTQARRRASQSIREKRDELKLSLRQVARRVKISAPALSQLERAESWESRTAERVARFLDRASEKEAEEPLADAA